MSQSALRHFWWICARDRRDQSSAETDHPTVYKGLEGLDDDYLVKQNFVRWVNEESAERWCSATQWRILMCSVVHLMDPNVPVQHETPALCKSLKPGHDCLVDIIDHFRSSPDTAWIMGRNLGWTSEGLWSHLLPTANTNTWQPAQITEALLRMIYVYSLAECQCLVGLFCTGLTGSSSMAAGPYGKPTDE